jgi:AraC family transcriptional regulator
MAESFEVKIVQVEPMSVVCFPAYCASPEEEALERLVAWARPLGLLDAPEKHRIFGFDTAGPSPASQNRGYEFWIQVAAGFQPVGDLKVREFSGGKYAVHRIEKVGNPCETILPAWKALVLWQEDSAYQMGKGQCLEEHIGISDQPLAECSMDLYLSVE